MASITEPKADLGMLAERLGNVAQGLRSLTANNPRLPRGELGALSAEMRAVAQAELGRRWNEPSERKGPAWRHLPRARAHGNGQLE